MTRIAIEYGIGGVFGLPVAITYGAMGDDEDASCIGVHVGPFYLIVTWRAA